MKLSSNSLGILIFTAIATAIFVLMALRPVVQGSAINFGAAVQATNTASSSDTVTETINSVTPTAKSTLDSAVNTSTENISEPAKTVVEITKDMVSDEENSAPIKMAPLKKSDDNGSSN